MLAGKDLPAGPRPLFLASVTGPKEAREALGAGAHIIDLKNPNLEPLGTFHDETVSNVVVELGDRVFLSAAAGLLGEQGESPMAENLSYTGVDVVKVGVPPGRESCLQVLSVSLSPPCRLVVVFFAEQPPLPAWLRTLHDHGVWGAMLDTLNKSGTGGLRKSLSLRALENFVERCRALELRCGLAGSLGTGDIQQLARLEPDYLGFRGALCPGGARAGRLDPNRVQLIRQKLEKHHEHTSISGTTR